MCPGLWEQEWGKEKDCVIREGLWEVVSSEQTPR